MRGIINNIINFYQMQAKALGVLMANTQKALEQSEKERKATEQIQRVENFIKNLTREVKDMLTRFYFHKERKEKKHKQMTNDEIKNLLDFVNFTKNVTEDVRLLLARSEDVCGQTFEKKIDKEIERLKAHVKQKLKEFDDALSGRNHTLKKRPVKHIGDIVGGVIKPLREKGLSIAELKRTGKSMAGRLTKVG